MHEPIVNFQTDKRQVINSFNIAAEGYKNVAALQLTVANRLLERLDYMKVNPERILDLGSGPGSAAKQLAKRYSKTKSIVQADIALRMLLASRLQFTRFFSRQSFICADAEWLPFAQTFDLVFSNLMLQWCNGADKVFTEVKKTLNTNGLFIFSSLGPDTLIELRECWSQVDDKVHVNTFMDMHDIGDGLIRAGFQDPVMEVERFTLTYRDVNTLMRELKQLGAHNVNFGRRHTLTGKNRMHLMQEEYEKKRSQGKLPVTYEVVYGHAWSAGPVTEKERGAGVATVPVSEIKRRVK